PANLVQAVAHHHQPTASQIAREEAAVVHLSDHLVNAMQIGSSGERHVPPLSMLAWEILRFRTDLLPGVVARIDEQIEAVQDIFLSKAIGALTKLLILFTRICARLAWANSGCWMRGANCWRSFPRSNISGAISMRRTARPASCRSASGTSRG